MALKFYIIAGEASGDLHGSNLIRALRAQAPDTQFRLWGGDLMAEAAGTTVVRHYRDLAFMGFWEVAKNLRTILGNLSFCKADIEAHRPDALILVDYPGFNMRIARWAKARGIRVIYYISPQIWAWRQGRVHAIRRDVDQMLTILPFEVEFYARFGMTVEFVGHPLLDVIEPSEASLAALPERPLVALLPGSRRQELQHIFPAMLAATRQFPHCDFVVAAASAMPRALYEEHMADYPTVQLQQGNTYDLLRRAHAALIKSGTSTLETALFGVPQVVCYKSSALSYTIAKQVVKVPYISLVNLIANAPVVEELIQHDLNPDNLARALHDILSPERRAAIASGYSNLRIRLGKRGASAKAAEAILKGLLKTF
jgi:lipid-A-disaccharide synthase